MLLELTQDNTDLEVGVSDGHQCALEMSRVAIFKSFEAGDLRRKLRFLAAGQVNALQSDADFGRSPFVGGSVNVIE